MLKQNQSPRSLLTLRIIWFALVFGQISFLFAVIAFILPNSAGKPATPQPLMNWVCAGMLVVEVPVAFLIRSIIFRGGQTENRIPYGRYSTGNIIFWAACEGVAFFGIIIVIINRSIMPSIVLVAIAIGLQAMTFPMGANVLLSDEAEDRV